MGNPNWQTCFRNLPEIPIHKRWYSDEPTFEQQIIMKVAKKETLNSDEEIVLSGLLNFYEELYKKLQTLDYATFTKEDLKNFELYIFYAFPLTAAIYNDYTIVFTYRLVVNEKVNPNHSNERIRSKSLLQYPTLEIVKENNVFNRASTPNSTVFYSGENIDTCLKELKPPLNKLVTVGVWKPNKNKKFRAFPIPFGEQLANEINEDSKYATLAASYYDKQDTKFLLKALNYYLKILDREYTKNIKCNFEYALSALFSEKILLQRDIPNNINYDFIVYPSVGNGYNTSNSAFRTDVIDEDFYLTKVIEFEIEESFYERPYLANRPPELISLAKIKKCAAT